MELISCGGDFRRQLTFLPTSKASRWRRQLFQNQHERSHIRDSGEGVFWNIVGFRRIEVTRDTNAIQTLRCLSGDAIHQAQDRAGGCYFDNER